MAGWNPKDFLDFLKAGQGVGGWIAKAMLAAPLLDWIVSFGPPSPDKVFVSFLTVLAEFLAALLCYEFLRGRRAGVYRRLLLIGSGLLVAVVGLYTLAYMEWVLALPPRVVKGSQYEELATQYRDGFRADRGRSPTDLEMLRDQVADPELGGAAPEVIVERLWTRGSVQRNRLALLALWVVLFATLSFCILVFLLRQQQQPSSGERKPGRRSRREAAKSPPATEGTPAGEG